MTHDLTDVELIFIEPCRGKADEHGKLGTDWRVVGMCGRRTDDTGWKYREFDRGEVNEMYHLRDRLNAELREQT